MLEIILSMFLGVILVSILFNAAVEIEKLSTVQSQVNSLQNKLQFMHFYFRKVIHQSGYGYCENKSINREQSAVETLTYEQVEQRFGLKIATNSNVLLVRSCVFINHRSDYLPVLYYENNKILYKKIANHRKETLLSGLNSFNSFIDPTKELVNIKAKFVSGVFSVDDFIVVRRRL